MKKLDSLVAKLRGIKPTAPFGDRYEDFRGKLEEPMLRATPSEEYCQGCQRPECDNGCAYAPKQAGSATLSPVLRRADAPPPAPPPVLSIHEAIPGFVPPTPKPTVSDVYRRTGGEIAIAIDHMIKTCEEARQEGLKLIEALYDAGEWHDDFLANYVNVQTQAASTMRDAWKNQIEKLRRDRAALMQVSPEAAPKGEQS